MFLVTTCCSVSINRQPESRGSVSARATVGFLAYFRPLSRNLASVSSTGPLPLAISLRMLPFFLYQILVRVTKAGETAPSANPRTNRTPIDDEKVVAAARHYSACLVCPNARVYLVIHRVTHHTMPPHSILDTVRFAVGDPEIANSKLTLGTKQILRAANDSSDT